MLDRLRSRHVVTSVFLLVLSGCRSDTWDAVIYPTGVGGSEIYIAGFASFEFCQLAAWQYLDRLGARESGDYECGRDCRFDSSYMGLICEETRR